jgi:hypothetical protein
MNTQGSPTGGDFDTWPALPLDAWRDTYATLHKQSCAEVPGVPFS